MRKKIPIGISDFKKIITGNYYFVDKSLMIKDVINDNSNVIVLPRPRRFGKTLNMSMLHYFFEKAEESNAHLFSGLAIENEPEFEEYQGQHPVVYISFKDAKGKNKDTCFYILREVIAKEYERHLYLYDNTKLFGFEEEREKFLHIAKGTAKPEDYATSLKFLVLLLKAHHQKEVIVLIDEYDSPIHASFTNGYYDDMISFMQLFLGNGLKDVSEVGKGVITGILRVAKESIFSGVNNLKVYTLLSYKYSKQFGFSPEEVKTLMAYFGEQHHFDAVNDWYNGYLFYTERIFNPWSVLSFVDVPQDGLQNYWVNTASGEILKHVIANSREPLQTELENLIQGKHIESTIEDNIVFPELTSNKRIVLSFLLFTGYLKAEKYGIKEDEPLYRLSLPNKEVQITLRKIVLSWVVQTTSYHSLQNMLNFLTNGRVKEFSEELNRFVIQSLSYFDVGGNRIEQTYQAFLLGMLINLDSSYMVKSNQESGYGRYDISLIPRDISHRGVILELKSVKPDDNEHTIDDAFANAARQIREKKYSTELKHHGVKDILELAVVFDGKRVHVKNIEEIK